MSSEIPKIDCVICGANEKWLNVDEYRLKSDGMCICTACGFCTYPGIVEKSEELKAFYRKDYRPAPTVANLFTGQRKLHYHANFLAPIIESWKKKNYQPQVFEVGAAFGLVLNWIKNEFPKADVSGSELTLEFRRVAWWQHHIYLEEEFDTSKRYDLIVSYKVAEHIPHIDKEIAKYAAALKSDGLLYISVPTWFHQMSNFGTDGFTLDYYYDKNHINVWTRKHFETLLRKCGLEVVQSNYVYYDATYLCKRNEKMKEIPAEYENSEEIIDKMSRIKKASIAFDSSQFTEAIAQFPAYPDAHIANYENNRNAWHQKGFDAIEKEVLIPARTACPESAKITLFCVDLCMRYDQLDKAMEYLKIGMSQKPGDRSSLIAVGHCYRRLSQKASNPEDKEKFLVQALEVMKHLQQISLQDSLEAITWIYGDMAKIPMPGEIACPGAP